MQNQAKFDSNVQSYMTALLETLELDIWSVCSRIDLGYGYFESRRLRGCQKWISFYYTHSDECNDQPDNLCRE